MKHWLVYWPTYLGTSDAWRKTIYPPEWTYHQNVSSGYSRFRNICTVMEYIINKSINAVFLQVLTKVRKPCPKTICYVFSFWALEKMTTNFDSQAENPRGYSLVYPPVKMDITFEPWGFLECDPVTISVFTQTCTTHHHHHVIMLYNINSNLHGMTAQGRTDNWLLQRVARQARTERGQWQ